MSELSEEEEFDQLLKKLTAETVSPEEVSSYVRNQARSAATGRTERLSGKARVEDFDRKFPGLREQGADPIREYGRLEGLYEQAKDYIDPKAIGRRGVLKVIPAEDRRDFLDFVNDMASHQAQPKEKFETEAVRAVARGVEKMWHNFKAFHAQFDAPDSPLRKELGFADQAESIRQSYIEPEKSPLARGLLNALELAPMVLATAATLPFGAPGAVASTNLWFTQIMPEAHREYLAQGMSEHRARQAAAATGIVEAAIEQLAMWGFKVKGDAGLRAFATSMFKEYFKETVLEEGSQAASRTAFKLLGVAASPGAKPVRITEEFKNGVKQVSEALWTMPWLMLPGVGGKAARAFTSADGKYTNAVKEQLEQGAWLIEHPKKGAQIVGTEAVLPGAYHWAMQNPQQAAELASETVLTRRVMGKVFPGLRWSAKERGQFHTIVKATAKYDKAMSTVVSELTSPEVRNAIQEQAPAEAAVRPEPEAGPPVEGEVRPPEEPTGVVEPGPTQTELPPAPGLVPPAPPSILGLAPEGVGEPAAEGAVAPAPPAGPTIFDLAPEGVGQRFAPLEQLTPEQQQQEVQVVRETPTSQIAETANEQYGERAGDMLRQQADQARQNPKLFTEEDVAKLEAAANFAESLRERGEPSVPPSPETTATVRKDVARSFPVPSGNAWGASMAAPGSPTAGRPGQPNRMPNSPLPAVIELPELTQMAKALVGRGQYPKVRQRLGFQAQGYFSAKTGITLGADVWKGPLVNYEIVPNIEAVGAFAAFQEKTLDTLNLKPNDMIFVNRPIRGTSKTELLAFQKDAEYANKVVAHEVGHAEDFQPDQTLGRGNILGRIAKLRQHVGTMIAEDPDGQANPITAEDKKHIQKRARARVSLSHKRGTITPRERQAMVRKEAAKMQVDLGHQRGLVLREEMMDELQELTLWWNPFDPDKSPKYTKYRFGAVELYAEAMSVLLNNPQELQKRAPNFYHSLSNYMGRRADFRDLYTGIQNEIRAGTGPNRLENQKQMYRKGEERKRQLSREQLAKEQADPYNTLFNRLKRATWTTAASLDPLEAKLKEQGKTWDPEQNPRYFLEELPYIIGQVSEFTRDVDRIGQQMNALGIDETAMGLYFGLRRASTERKYMANPLGIGGEQAVQALNDLEAELGPEKMQAVEAMAEVYYRMRETHVFPPLRQSGLLNQEQMDYIESNINYATFNVQSYMEGEFGGARQTAAIYKQIGTLSEIENPFTATIMKDISLIRASVLNEAKRVLAEQVDKQLAGEFEDAKRDKSGQFAEPAAKNKGLLLYSADGKLEGKIIPAVIAETYKSDGTAAKIITDALGLFGRPFKEIYTGRNPGFSIFNIVRDMKRNYKNIKGATLKDVFRQIVPGIQDAIRDVYLNESSEVVQEMKKNRMMVEMRTWGGKEVGDADTALERELASYGVDEMKDRGLFAKIAYGLWDQLGKIGSVGERFSKIVGYRVLKEQQAQGRDITNQELAHQVRSMAGSPDFLAGGSLRAWYNNIFLFSNAKIQGWRGDIEAWKNSPMEVLWKTASMDLLPKTMMWLVRAGALSAALTVMFPGRDKDDWIFGWADWLEQAMKKIPKNDLANYLCIPLGSTKDGETIYHVQPQDFGGQMLGSVLWSLLDNKADPGEVLKAIQSENPIAMTNINPAIGVAYRWMQYMVGANPYDAWRGETILTEREKEARGWVGLKALGRYEYNKSLGNAIYYWKQEGVKPVHEEARDKLNIPIAGPLIRRLIRVSDKGRDDLIRKKIEKVRQKEATKESKVRTRIFDSINALKSQGGVDTAASKLYDELEKEDLLPENYLYMRFRHRYRTYAIKRFGTEKEKAELWKTLSEKAVVGEFFPED